MVGPVYTIHIVITRSHPTENHDRPEMSSSRMSFQQSHLFVGSENALTPIVHFQLFVVADGDGFLGNTKRRWVTTASVVQFS